MTEPGLREQKRRATAYALARAAFELACARGLDGFTINDVADRATVSRRTFANYYSCKEEAVTAVAIEQLRAGIESMPDFPASLPLLDWVRALAKHQLSGGMLTLLRQLRKLALEFPALNPYVSEVHAQIRRTAQDAVSKRAGSGFSQLTAHILVGAAYGALTALIEGPVGTAATPISGQSTMGDGDLPPADSATIDSFLGRVFQQLRTGF